MDTRELQAAIHQAVIDGDTEMVKQLNTTLRRLTTSSFPTPTEAFVSVQRSNVRPQGRQFTISISFIICFIFLPYWAIAEIAAPGHQGLAKVHQASWLWGPKLLLAPLKGFKPKVNIPKPLIPRISDKPVVRSPEDVLLTCGEHEGNPFVKFTLSNVDFFIYSIEECKPGVVNEGSVITKLTPASYMETDEQGKISQYDRTQLEEFFGK